MGSSYTTDGVTTNQKVAAHTTQWASSEAAGTPAPQVQVLCSLLAVYIALRSSGVNTDSSVNNTGDISDNNTDYSVNSSEITVIMNKIMKITQISRFLKSWNLENRSLKIM